MGLKACTSMVCMYVCKCVRVNVQREELCNLAFYFFVLFVEFKDDLSHGNSIFEDIKKNTLDHSLMATQAKQC